MRSTRLFQAALAGLLTVSACSDSRDSTAGPSDAPSLLAIVPANGTTGVDPGSPIVITFDHAMMPGMEVLVALYRTSVTGPQVDGVATWSADRTVLTFAPAAPLEPHTTYVLHLAPNLRDARGQRLDPGSCARLGGRQVNGAMLGAGPRAGMLNGPWGQRMGWRAADGTYGMIFTFTTA